MQITVYSAPWCPDCRAAKRFLDEHKLPYTAIPQFVIDGEWVQPYVPGEGFLYEEMSKRLGLDQ
jgi:mycoredoxin